MMKTFKYILSTFLVISIIWSCTDDELNNLDFLDSAVAPTNVEALFTITQDNTGTVTIFPAAENATRFEVDFGDGDKTESALGAGKSVEHIYAEGTYSVNIIAIGVTGLKTELTNEIVVSFNKPVFGTNPIIENDKAVSKKVNVTVPDDTEWAMSYDVYFVEDGIETIVTGNIEDMVSYTYENPGIVDIKVVLKGGAIETTEYLLEGFEVTEILAPITSAPTPDGRSEADYYSIFSDVYTTIEGTDFNPFWWQATVYSLYDVDGDEMLQYSTLNYQGINIGETIDVSGMEFLHLDVWTADLPEFKTFLINGVDGNSTEVSVLRDLTLNDWTSIDIPISEYTDQGLTVDQIFQLKFEGENSGTIFVDNLYFWKEPSEPSPLIGTWMFAPEAGVMEVGGAIGDYSWWSNNLEDVATRACIFDDEYIIGADGTFRNVLGSETWVESWQEGVPADSEYCATPIAPHDGSNPATWSSTTNTVTVSGLGAYLGLAKVHADGEDGNPDNNPITYNYVLSEDGNTLDLTILVPWGAWHFKMVRKESPSPFVGTWKIAPEEGALKVSETPGGNVWWYLNQWGDDITDRACLLDDEYVFNADGSFSNVLGTETWLEDWQGDGTQKDVCGTPIAPHDGSNPATWESTETTVTVSGLGAYLGIAKPHNTAEDGAPIDNTITYNYVLSDNGNTLELTIQGFNGDAEWYYKLVK